MKLTRKECGYAAEREKRVLLLEAYLAQGVRPSARIAELVGLTPSKAQEIAKEYYLRRMETLWELVSKPLKFPAPDRRRRKDREWPKAA